MKAEAFIMPAEPIDLKMVLFHHSISITANWIYGTENWKETTVLLINILNIENNWNTLKISISLFNTIIALPILFFYHFHLIFHLVSPMCTMNSLSAVVSTGPAQHQ